MKRILFVFSFLSCFLYCPISVWADDVYDISAHLSQGTLKIHAELRNILSNEKLCLPAFGQRYGETLHSVRITSHPNTKQFKPDSAGCFYGVSGSSIIIDYELKLKPLESERFWIASELSSVNTNGMIAMPGESLFVERGADDTETSLIKTMIKITDAGWIVSTLPDDDSASEIIIQNTSNGQLQAIGKEPPKVQFFTANDRFELTRSYWAFGQFKHREVTSGKTKWTIAVSSDWNYNDSILQREIIAILGYYQRILSPKTPSHIAIYIFNAPFDADYHHGFARPNGIILQLGLKAASESDTRRILMAHELFHLYNGEGLRFDVTKQNETAWFREGMTQYMTFRALLSLGLISPVQFYHWIASSIQKQNNSHYDCYHHGFFVSFAIEQQWALYQTAYSIEGFWQFLAESTDWNQRHTNASLQKLLTQYSAFDFEQFFNNYTAPNSKLPIRNLLRLSGLCIYSNKSIRYFTGAEYGFNPNSSQLYITKIVPNSPAEQGGLRKGDIVIPEKNINWHDAADKNITLMRKGKKIMLRIPVTTEMRNDIIVDKCH